MDRRSYTPLDHLIATFDQALRTVFGQPQITGRPNPADTLAEPELTHAERMESGRLMRVNHAGEVCAQALYQGQALTARHQKVRDSMQQAAREENDHLDWCDRRIRDLDSHRSYLNPAWYGGSFALGALAGAIGDKWSLGYVAETERQVVDHIDAHLNRLPEADSKSRAILEQMKEDEGRHGTMALAAGGTQLPRLVTHLMRLGSRLMTGTTYWI
jgi:ubiquinone biosynthesis monooxygenase Coq7